MQTGCIVEVFKGEMLSTRAIKQSVPEAENFIDNFTKSEAGVSGMVYWAVYADEQEAIYGWFASRSSGYSYPIFKFYKQDKSNEFSSEIIRRRTAFAIEVVSNLRRLGRTSERSKTLRSYITLLQREVPDEDWVWRRDVITAYIVGQAYPSHPSNEVAFFVRMLCQHADPI